MLFLILLTGFTLVTVGAIAGRAYERNLWQQRLLARLGAFEGSSRLSFAVERAALNTVATEPNSVDQAIEAMAVEIERIGEGQRFLTKLMAERPVSSVAPVRSPRPAAVHSTYP